MKTFIICPYLWNESKLDFAEKEKEASLLASAIDLEVVATKVVKLRLIKPGFLFSDKVITDVEEVIKDNCVGLVIIDTSITGIMQRNLEKAWQVKVIDRTGLILEIFGARAVTKEGKLQVELAACQYQRSRLVRSWTHLERQRGGLGTVGGPGESQLEIDRRLIGQRLKQLKSQLQKVTNTRKTNRSARQKVPFPVIALVGYTNAGKSTLFNQLTKANVQEKDMLFTTLDPTMRLVELPQRKKIILSDTVGFIANLPTMLVAAFKATLEEVVQADIIVHIQDGAYENWQYRRDEVLMILEQLGVEITPGLNYLNVCNKMDLLNQEQQSYFTNRDDDFVLISAQSGQKH